MFAVKNEWPMEQITVLLVEDDAICAFLCKKILESIGLAKQVYSATNGKEALEIFNKCFSGEIGVPELILLDLNMPVVDGFQFIQAFKNCSFPIRRRF